MYVYNLQNTKLKSKFLNSRIIWRWILYWIKFALVNLMLNVQFNKIIVAESLFYKLYALIWISFYNFLKQHCVYF